MLCKKISATGNTASPVCLKGYNRQDTTHTTECYPQQSCNSGTVHMLQIHDKSTMSIVVWQVQSFLLIKHREVQVPATSKPHVDLGGWCTKCQRDKPTDIITYFQLDWWIMHTKHRWMSTCSQIWCHESCNKSQEENAKEIALCLKRLLEDCKPRIDSAMLARKQLQCYFLGSGAMKVTTSRRKRMQRDYCTCLKSSWRIASQE